MTLKELYALIDGDYDRAMNVLRIEKLLDKHIRRFPQNGIVDSLVSAGTSMDANGIFESAHALKGVCANLGLVKMASEASELTEEFRPGSTRKLSDGDIRAKISAINEMYKKASEGIRLYEQSAQ